MIVNAVFFVVVELESKELQLAAGKDLPLLFQSKFNALHSLQQWATHQVIASQIYCGQVKEAAYLAQQVRGGDFDIVSIAFLNRLFNSTRHGLIWDFLFESGYPILSFLIHLRKTRPKLLQI